MTNARSAQHGMTLMEIIVASAIAAVVLIAIGVMGTGGTRMHQDVHDRYDLLMGEQSNAGLAAAKIAKAIEGADRILIRVRGAPAAFPTTGSVLQLRFTNCNAAGNPNAGNPACFGVLGNYWWEEYRWNNPALEFLDRGTTGTNNCANPMVLARDIINANFQFQVGDPLDGIVHNTMTYTLTWNNGTNSHTFSGEAESRAVSELRNVDGGGNVVGDSGPGVDVGGVSPPPPPCP